MRKLIKPLLCGMMVTALLSGCSGKDQQETTPSETTSAGAAAEASTEAESQENIEPGEITSLGEYKGLEITRMSAEVTEEELEARIQSILDANPEYVAVTDRAAQNGDIVDIDYVGLKDGVAFDGGTAQGYKLELGSHSFIDGFEEGLVGAKTGEERSLNLTFPEQYHSADLAGQAVVFEVTVNGIEEKRDAVLDDNFVQRMSDFNTVDEFKADTMEDIEAEKKQQADQQLENDIILAAVENSQFNLNEAAVEQQYENQMSYLTSMIQMYGGNMKDYAEASGMTEEEFQKEIRSNVETGLKVQIMMEAIAEKEGIQVEDSDREELAKMYSMTVKDLQEMYGEDAVDEVALNNKVRTFLKDNAIVK
ncbi:MAG: trigger factor [Lachnospiraceae bacterium]|jgi:trigger factor|nr:trigger factor [Lachnospiraceae bacterium]